MGKQFHLGKKRSGVIYHTLPEDQGKQRKKLLKKADSLISSAELHPYSNYEKIKY